MIRVLIFSFVTLIIAFPAQAKVLDIQEVKSPDGITAWLVEDHSVPVISIQFAFKGSGSVNDPKNKQGLARLASNTMDEGAGNLNAVAFQKELRDLSISLSYSSRRDDFSGSLKTLTKNKDRAFELLKLSLTEPRFDKEAVDRMRKANQARIRSSLSDPKWKAARLLNDKAFENHPYALNSGGTLSSLENITSKDLKDFHTRRIGKNNLVVSVVGDIKSEELGVLLDEIFGELPDVEMDEKEPSELQNQGSIFLYEQDIPQSVIEIMQPGIARNDPDYETAKVMNFILGSSGFGSRLTEEIREKRGLTYGIYSYTVNLDQTPSLAVSTSTANKNVPEMLSLISTEFQKFKDQPVSPQELSDAKAYLIGSLPLSLTSTDKISGLLLSLQMDDLPIDYLDQREKKIESTTVQDIQTLAQKLLDPQAFITIIVGQPEELEEPILVKDLPNVE